MTTHQPQQALGTFLDCSVEGGKNLTLPYSRIMKDMEMKNPSLPFRHTEINLMIAP
jgi:hypothetical protein